jgi:hypothetical protein
MISAQTPGVCREGKPVPTFPDHASGHHLDDFTLMLRLGENEQVTFLRSLITAGLIFLRRSETYPPGTLRWRASSKEASVAFASDTASVFSSSTTNLDFSRVQFQRGGKSIDPVRGRGHARPCNHL